MKAYKSYIATSGSVVVMFNDGSMQPIPVENPMYQKVVDLLQAHRFEEIVTAVDIAATIKEASNGRFYVVDGLVWIDGETLPDTLSKRLIGFAEAGIPTDSLESFWNNLKLNPSLRSREHLYAFLDHNGIPLTEDGCFIAYKRVNENYMDCHTSTFDNSVGAVVTMDRDKVNANPEETCSSGLHVAAFPYAKDFYSNGHLMEVKVNPMDVVAVPNDYNGQKMRVCKYEVMRECDQPRPDNELVYPSFDEDADEDVWDEDDTCEGCGLEDCVCDDVEEALDTESDDVSDVSDDDYVVVHVDNRGRVGVPARMVRVLGLAAGDLAYASAINGEVIITPNGGGTNDRVYVVGRDDDVRVTAYLLDLAGLGKRKNLDVELEGNARVVIS